MVLWLNLINDTQKKCSPTGNFGKKMIHFPFCIAKHWMYELCCVFKHFVDINEIFCNTGLAQWHRGCGWTKKNVSWSKWPNYEATRLSVLVLRLSVTSLWIIYGLIWYPQPPHETAKLMFRMTPFAYAACNN